MQRLAVLLGLVVATLVAGAALSPAPAAAHTCAVSSEITMDPTPDDVDDDCVRDQFDNCTGLANPDQLNHDDDSAGDACDTDDDNDGILDAAPDNCRTVPNSGQERTRHPIYGDECLFDRDGDAVLDAEDNCIRRSNPDQANNDGDGAGDACDADDDNDGVLDGLDNCPRNVNKDQANADADALGNACDPDFFAESSFVAPPPSAAPVGVAKTVDRTAARVSLKLARVQRASDAHGGMPASVRCSEACAVSAELTLSRAVAKRLKLKALVASGMAALEGSGRTYVFLDFTKPALKRLFRATQVTATLTLKVLDGAGNATSVRQTVRLAK